MELHIVNIAPDAPQCEFEKSLEHCVSVVGVMYTIEGEENAEDDVELTRMINSLGKLPKKADYGIEKDMEETRVDAELNINALLPKNRAYYTYKGSLTSPPCTETLLWHVLATPMKISRSVVNKIRNGVAAIDENSAFDARVPLDLNGRSVFYYDGKSNASPCPSGSFGGASNAAVAEEKAGERAEEDAVAANDAGSEDNMAFSLGSSVVALATAAAAFYAAF
eukprot:TRINITY_DN47995_c0_g1_i1.p1 TRINITY_DN47995_c0_g1~~TRINITY_DN47995_c0_g1_i1.p1  ORF type:complete len:223 (-),score=47.33 TRINITY_DN47995_c0_g1_i1:680-1348(-)